MNNMVTVQDYNKYISVKKSEFLYKSVKKGAEDAEINDGWEIHNDSYKTVTQLKKRKLAGMFFEDKVWATLAQMGFSEMNLDNEFKIPLSQNGNGSSKQIDVFAKEERVAVFIECKAATTLIRKSLRDTILEYRGIWNDAIRYVKSEYTDNIKIRFVLATSNIIINDSDKQLAEDSNIIVLTNDDFEYYNELITHLGYAARYQFLAQIFKNQKIPGLDIQVPAIQGRIGNHKFYSFAIEPSKLLPIAFVQHRRITQQDTLVSYQRMIKKNRLKSIRKYIEEEGGLFPNNIILNFETGNRELLFVRREIVGDSGSRYGTLHLPNHFKSAWIIDGQHRLYGFAGTSFEDKITIPVIAFENLEPELQAKMFVDINSKQVMVPRNLLEDLYSDLLWDSEKPKDRLYALTSKVVSKLANDLDSPLYSKIISSVEKSSTAKPITITTLTTAIRSNGLIGKVKSNASGIIPGPLFDQSEPIMENSLFRTLDVLKFYFSLFKERNSDNWGRGSDEGGYLCTNNGLSSLLIVLKEIFNQISIDNRISCFELHRNDLKDGIRKYSTPLVNYFNGLDLETLRTYRQQYGAGGQKNSALAMMEQINIVFPEFKPPSLDDYIKARSLKYNEQGRIIVPQLEIMISEHILTALKDELGRENEKWWFDGVPEEVRLEVVKRQQIDPEHGEKEKYFDLVHFEKIISKHWLLFGDVYGFEHLGNSKKDKLSWFNKINTIRNKLAHPVRGLISEEEFKILQDTYNLLNTRLYI